ncbi:hypothetical protein [Actinomadura oligospora]|uniref:hypothetical protein n=1 Tax=Actinomadura oligospora TaxID=111804 RepID=UPI00047BE25F|nr:hypothetical protein [Actinomadura oligospora]
MAAELPLSGDELAWLLNQTLGMPVGGVRMRVERVEPGGTSARPEVRVRVVVSDDSASLGVWEVDVPMDPLDLEPEVNAPALVAILAGNLREWWELKGVEARIGRWGRPV